MDHKTIYVLINLATGGFDLGGANNRRAVRAYRTLGQAKAAKSLIEKNWPSSNTIIICEYNLKGSENA